MSSALNAQELTLQLMNCNNRKGTRVINPLTGLMTFGAIPANSHVPEGDIFLKLGIRGRGYDRLGAFGVRHIWDKHGAELGAAMPGDIPSKVYEILAPGADILLDTTKGAGKIITLNTSKGMVILQEEKAGNYCSIYSIITAYTKKTAKGILIASLK